MRSFRPAGSTVFALSLSLGALTGACKGDDAAKKGPNPAAKAAAKPKKSDGEKKQKPVSAAKVLEKAKPLFGALPKVMKSDDNPVTDAKVELGRLLYHDKRLSKNQDISCASCHDLENFGIDVRAPEGKRQTSAGHKGQMGERNSPTSYNAAIHVAQFWDGRAPTVEEQAKGPILNPVEMAMPDEGAAVAVLKSIPGYAEKFAAAFPDAKDAITYDNMARAIGAFERTLVTPSKFDAFLGGEMGALSQDELRGLELFIDVGCITCHTGPALGGSMFQKLGVIKPYETKDEGRFAVTKNEADKFVFKVPGLRNVAKTAPYFHDGSIATLKEAVEQMTKHQLAKGQLSEPEMKSMLAFLDSLTGEPPAGALGAPALPESGPKTPKPDPT